MNATEQATIKINTEMQSRPSDAFYEAIGQYVIDRCADAAAAETVLAKGKTLKGAVEKVTAAAKSHRQGNMAVMRDDEVFAIVSEYFGLEGLPDNRLAPPVPAAQSRRAVSVDFDSFF